LELRKAGEISTFAGACFNSVKKYTTDMSLEAKINADLKAAMQRKDQVALRGIRAVKSAILLAKTEKGGAKELSPEKEIDLLQKLIKQRKDSIKIYQKQDRQDLAKKELEEVEVIQQYLPKQLSDAELTQVLEGIIDQTGAQSMKDMGKVMGMASKKLAGRADNKTIATKVKALLSE